MSPQSAVLPYLVRPGEIPQFSLLGEYPFQDICRDLFDQEPSIATCDLYGVRGQSQDGIDLLAHRNLTDEIEVGQCKCYSQFPPAKIRKASKDFFDHWNRWSSQNVKRFILFVACPLDRKNQQDEIIKQTAIFGSCGIRYEAWSGATIRNKLQPHPAIVSRYFPQPEYWVQAICGNISAVLTGNLGQHSYTVTVVQTALVTQVDQLSSFLGDDTERQIDRLRVAWREGQLNEVEDGLRTIRDNQTRWAVLPPRTKAKVLRFEASWVLQQDDNEGIGRRHRAKASGSGLALRHFGFSSV